MTTLTFAALSAACEKRQMEWRFGGRAPDLLFRIVEMCGEAGEAANIAKKLVRERMGAVGSRATPEDLAAELADVVICAVNVSLCEGLDLSAAIADKFNKTSQANGLKTTLPTTSDLTAGDLFVVDGDELDPLQSWTDVAGAIHEDMPTSVDRYVKLPSVWAVVAPCFEDAPKTRRALAFDSESAAEDYLIELGKFAEGGAA